MPKPEESLTFEQGIAAATLEGFILLRAEAKEKSKPEPFAQKPELLETKLGSMSDNAFMRARVQILTKMSDFCRKEIKRMEKEGNTENRVYNEFAHNCRVLGEQFEKKQYGD